MISVIVPVYNGEKYIERCVDSILRQTEKNFELIIVNDGSTDNTAAALKKYDSDSRLKTIHTENRGVSAARNTGVDNASGRYITFVDADDRLETDSLEKLHSCMIQYNADIVIMTKRNMDRDKERKEASSPRIWAGEEIFLKALEDHASSHSVYAKLYDRQLLEGIRFEEGRRIHEDSFFLFKCFAAAKKAVYSQTDVYRYYVTPGSASRAAFSEKYFDILYFAQKKIQIIKEKYPQYSDKIPYIKVRANMALLYNMAKTYERKYRSVEKECINTIKKNSAVFTPATAFEKRMLKIIRFRIFWLYKIYLNIRFRKNMR